jgi:hypothetical protein
VSPAGLTARERGVSAKKVKISCGVPSRVEQIGTRGQREHDVARFVANEQRAFDDRYGP